MSSRSSLRSPLLIYDTNKSGRTTNGITDHFAQNLSSPPNHFSTTAQAMSKVASTALEPYLEDETSYELQLDDTVYLCKSIIGPEIYKQIEKVHKMRDAGVTDVERYARIDAKICDLTEDQMAMMAGKSVLWTRLRRQLRAMLGFKKDNIQYSLGYSNTLDDTRTGEVDREVCAFSQQEEQEETKGGEEEGDEDSAA